VIHYLFVDYVETPLVASELTLLFIRATGGHVIWDDIHAVYVFPQKRALLTRFYFFFSRFSSGVPRKDI